LVNSLNRPDGNLTGVAILANTLARKQLQLLRELAPKVKLVAFLTNPKSPNTKSETRNVQAAAGTTGQQILILSASNDSDLDSAFAALVQQKAEALLVQSDPLFNARADKIAALASRYAIPAIYQLRDFPAAGGLMSYGTDLADAYRLVGVYTGKILQGAKPADLPVQQSVKVQLVINLRTAKALGLNVPNTLIGRADEVIE
jgi:putative ABC transport system substrate-binding protein